MIDHSLCTSALLVIDLQRYFLEKGAPAFLNPSAKLLPNIVRLIDAFRASHLPVIFTRHAHIKGSDTGEMGRFWGGHLPWEGTRNAELITAIKPLPDEPVIVKSRYSAFEGTNLEAFLRTLGVTTLTICGVMTNCCVETTARHAFLKDISVIVVNDACAASKPAYHRASLLNLGYAFARIEKTSTLCTQLQP